jgi:hypothetical protein
MRFLLLSLFLSFSNAADAGSICNDGTYSYSEGSGTCSWHGGVATSGVYLDSQQSNSHRDQAGSNQRWVDSYDVHADGDPYHDTTSLTLSGIFSYTCYVLKDRTIGETIIFLFPFDADSRSGWSVASAENVKVFAHSQYGHSLISGRWAWTTTSDGMVALMKVRGSLPSPASAEPLLPRDMAHILMADRLVVSIQGEKNIVIPTPDAANKITSTWGKCRATLQSRASWPPPSLTDSPADRQEK